MPIFTMPLGLSRPWFIRDVSFQLEQGKRVLHIEVDHELASKFEYQGKAYSVYDHHRRSWRHLIIHLYAASLLIIFIL